MSLRRNTLVAYLTAVVILALDQLSKFWILEVVRLEEVRQAPLFWPLKLTMVWNPGVSFGLLRADLEVVRWGLTAFSLVVAASLAWWARTAERRLLALALGLVMGGAVGNAIDRARFGQVVDFIDATDLAFPWVFNVGDSAITIGICLLILDSLMPAPVKRAT